MSQERFHYDYGSERDAIKNAKRYCAPSHEHHTVVVQNPKDGRYLILMCANDDDLPTRVPILWKADKLPPPAPIEHETGDMMNAIFEMVEQGVICIHVVNHGANVHQESLDGLCAEWIETGTIDPANWQED